MYLLFFTDLTSNSLRPHTDIAEELHMKTPGQSLTGADRKAMREAMARAVPAEQRDKLRGIHEGFLGPMINCSAEVTFTLKCT